MPLKGRSRSATGDDGASIEAGVLVPLGLVLAIAIGLSLSPTAIAHADDTPENCPGGGIFDPEPIDPPVLRCLGTLQNGTWYAVEVDEGDDIRAFIEPVPQDGKWTDYPASGTLCLHEDQIEYPITCSQRHWNYSVLLEHEADADGTLYLTSGTHPGDEFLLSVTLNEQTESGSLALGTEARVDGDPAWNVDQRLGPERSPGVDGEWIRLAEPGTSEERIELTHRGDLAATGYPTGSAPIFATLYDAEGNELTDYHCDRFATEHLTCTVAPETAWVLVETHISVNPGYEFRYLY
jgi:hypothetical protein